MAKEYEIRFMIAAALAGGFKGAFSSASDTMGKLQQRLSGFEKNSATLGAFQKLQERVGQTSEKLVTAREKVRVLSEEMRSTGTPTAAMRNAFTAANVEANKLQERLTGQRVELGKLRTSLSQAGVSTKDFAAEQSRLAAQAQRVQAAQERLQRSQGRLDAVKGRLSGMKGELLSSAATFFAFAAPTRAAMAFESSMADVRKVVDFETQDQYRKMAKDIENLSRYIPQSAEGLAQIAASAGQAGIAREDIANFTSTAAKMGVAFDITAEQAGDMMAIWRTSFKIGQDEVTALADQVNYLSNTSAAKAPALAGLLTKVGSVGEIANATQSHIAALGATLLATGVQEDVAATGIKNFILALTAGGAATKRQRDVYKALRIDPEILAKEMMQDPQKVMTGVLGRIKSLPKHLQASYLSQLFGRESVTSISKLLSNTELLQEMFDKVGDASKYAGSMEKEFQERSKTTANAVQIMRNKMMITARALGNVLLPWVSKGAEILGWFADKVTWLTQKFPTLTKLVLGTALAFGAFKVGSTAVRFGILALQLPFLKAATAIDKIRVAAVLSGKASVWRALKAKGLSVGKWLISPMGLTVLAIAAVVAAAWWLYRNWDTVCTKMRAAWDWVKTKVAAGWEKLKGSFVWKGLSDMWDWLVSAWDKAYQWVIDGWERLKGFVAGIPAYISETLSGLADRIFEPFNTAFGWIEGAIDRLKGAWSSFKAFFTGDGGASNDNVAAANALFSEIAVREAKAAVGKARGGIIRRPTFALLGERSRTEVVVPTERPTLGIPLWVAAGEMMGMDFGGSSSVSTSEARTTYAPTFSITVHGGDDGVAAKFEAIVRRVIREDRERYERLNWGTT